MSEVRGRGSEVGLPAEARSAKAGDRDRLDTAIDLAVREMLDVEPPPGLRRRVVQQISDDGVASAFRRKDRFGRQIVWIAAPLAAAAVILLAVLAPWRTVAPPVLTSAPPSMAKRQPPPVVSPSLSPKATQSSRTTPVPLPYSRPAVDRRPSPPVVDERIVAAAADDDGAVIDPLAPIAPIVAAGTHPQDIAPKEIAISPMAPIAHLQIAPLSPPERRN